MGNPSPPENWDLTYETNPAPGDVVSQGDDWIRQVKLDIRKRAEVEAHFGSVNGDDNGLLRVGSARAFVQNAAPTVIEQADYNNTTGSSGTATLSDNATNSSPAEKVGLGRLWLDTDDNVLYVYTTAGWVAVNNSPISSRVEFKTSTSNNFGSAAGSVEVETTTTAVVAPLVGTCRMMVSVVLNGVVYGSPGTGNCQINCFIDENKDGAGFVAAGSSVLVWEGTAGGNNSIIDLRQPIPVNYIFTPTPGSSYIYKIRPTTSSAGGGWIDGTLTAAAGRPHTIKVELVRVA